MTGPFIRCAACGELIPLAQALIQDDGQPTRCALCIENGVAPRVPVYDPCDVELGGDE